MLEFETAPDRVSIHTVDPDEAMSVGGSIYYPHRYTRVTSSRRFRMGLDATRIGPFTVGVISYEVDLELRTGDLGAYQFNVPIRGTLRSRSAGYDVAATPKLAASYLPTGDAQLRCQGRWSAFVGVKIESGPLERHLASLLRDPVDRTIEFGPTLDLTGPLAAAWWAMVEPLTDPTAAAVVAGNRLVARPLTEAMLTALLLAGPHQYLQPLQRSCQPARSSTVRRAVELLDDSPEHPWTPAELATSVACGLRTLQKGFRTELGTTIMGYLQTVRMSRARAELVASAPGSTVSRIANDWGFLHLGRFAQRYHATYGEHPSTTLLANRS